MLTVENPWIKAGETVVMFGDSLTANPSGYTGMLEQELSKRGIRMIRSGLSGDKTPGALMRLKADVLAHKPDAVCLFFGTNDAVIGHGRWGDEPTISPCAYQSNLVWLMHLCRLAGVAKHSVIPPLYRPEGLSYAEFGEAFQPYCQAARHAANALRARFVPADIAFAEEWALHPGHTGLLLTTDGVHLEEKGCRLLTRQILFAWGLSDTP